MADMTEVEVAPPEGAAEVQQTLAEFSDEELLVLLKSCLGERPSVIQDLVFWAVPDRAYVGTRLLAECRAVGRIKNFFTESGYGFIECPEVFQAFGQDTFLHHGQIGSFAVGDEVSFALLLNKDRKPQAVDLAKAANGVDLRNKEPKDQGWDTWSGMGYAKGRFGKGDFGKGADPMGGWYDPSWGQKGCMGEKGCMGVKGFKGLKGPPLKGSKGWYDPSWDQPAGPPPPAQQKAARAAKGKGKREPPTQQDVQHRQHEMPGVTDRRYEGVIKSFSEKTGFGFIACEELTATFGNDVFLHSTMMGGFGVGQAVSFSVGLNKTGQPQAKDLAEPGDDEAEKRPAPGGKAPHPRRPVKQQRVS